MLAASELRWWPLAPLLLAQGLYVRLVTDRLPPARDRRGGSGAGARTLTMAGVGDSIIAGIGVQHMAQGLVGQVAARIAERDRARVEWHAIGESGVTAAVVLQRMAAAAVRERPALVVVSVGVNDAVAGTPPMEFQQRLRAIVDTLTADADRVVIFAGIPPLAAFPALPRPLATLLGQRAALLAAAAAGICGYRGLRVVRFPATLDRDGFAPDGFHPGPQACAVWSQWVATALAQSPDRSRPLLSSRA